MVEEIERDLLFYRCAVDENYRLACYWVADEVSAIRKAKEVKILATEFDVELTLFDWRAVGDYLSAFQ